VQLALPLPSPNEPAEQVSHEVLPDILDAFPGLQLLHSLALAMLL